MMARMKSESECHARHGKAGSGMIRDRSRNRAVDRDTGERTHIGNK